MMPPAYIQALLESENPFGAKPVHDFKIIREIVEEAHGRPLHDVFSEFSFVPVATGSIAQVHFAVLRESGAEVAVKVTKGRLNQAALLGDVETMLVTAKLLKLSGMDGGIDLPTIIKSYMEIVPEEFDLRLESEKMERFAELFAEWGLDDRVLIPTVVPELTSRDVLVIERIRGVGMIDVLQAAGATGDRPVLPAAAAGLLGDWDGFFQTVFEAWGRMIFLNGTFHTDPHPGNLGFSEDGRVYILDFGQTKTLRAEKTLRLARVVRPGTNSPSAPLPFAARDSTAPQPPLPVPFAARD